MAFAGVIVLLENKNLVFLGTSTEKGYDPLPFATGTYNYKWGYVYIWNVSTRTYFIHHLSQALGDREPHEIHDSETSHNTLSKLKSQIQVYFGSYNHLKHIQVSIEKHW